MSVDIDRRGFGRAVGFLGASILWPANGFSQAAGVPQIVRKDTRELENSPDELDKYREAFRRLKEKGPERPQWRQPADLVPFIPNLSDLAPLGHSYQAALHFYHCPHGNWWFLPWHRMYLFYFEQVLAAAVADYMPRVPLAIPYWDWTEQRDVPVMFKGDATSNPLSDDRRYWDPTTVPETVLREDEVGAQVVQNDVDETPAFQDFGSSAACRLRDQATMSAFESGPHGMVHVRVGWYDGIPVGPWSIGRPGTFRYVPTAAFDPIFWSHHANIDRLWSHWLSLFDPARHNDFANPSFGEACPDGQTTWGSIKFPDFVDGTGQAVNATAQTILSQPALKTVSYKKYMAGNLLAVSQPREATMKDRVGVGARQAVEAAPVLHVGRPLSLSIDTRAEAVAAAVRTVLEDKPKAGRLKPLIFRIQDVQVPHPAAPPVAIRAFVNKPEASMDTDTKDPHFAGTMSFFGAGHSHEEDHAGPRTTGFSLNIAPALRRLGDTVKPDEPVTVTLVLVPLNQKQPTTAAHRPLPFNGAKLLLSD